MITDATPDYPIIEQIQVDSEQVQREQARRRAATKLLLGWILSELSAEPQPQAEAQNG